MESPFDAKFGAALLAPRYWRTWIVLGVMVLLARRPAAARRAAGRAIGAVAARFGRKRRAIARTNLAMCLPDLDEPAREKLLDANLRELGQLAGEVSLGLFGSERALSRVGVDYAGFDHLKAARAAGRGVLLLSAHFSHLELAGSVLARIVPLACLYPDHADQAFVWAMKRARGRYGDAMFGRDQVRALVKYLKGGGIALFAADHPSKGKGDVTATFFGVPAATATATHHLARMSGCVVIPFFERRVGDRYEFRLEPPLADFPGEDPAADAQRLNALMERMIREAPEQYLWSYKRFKGNAPDPYA